MIIKFKDRYSEKFLYFLTSLLLLLIAGLYNLERIPAAWWDEGWTLSVARNWIEIGHYGRLINGEFISPNFSGAFPVVIPVAISMKLLGTGIWQGRIPSLLFLLGSLAILFYIAEKLHNRRIAFATLIVLFFLSGPAQLNPLTLGRTVMAEIPMLFYLLSGYLFLFLALRKSPWWILPAALLWGIAINTKAQALPFWLASLLLPLGVTVIKRWWQQAGLLFAGLILSWVFSICLLNLVKIMIPELGQVEPIPGLVQVVAMVLEPGVRKIAIMVTLTIGLPTLCGFLYAAWGSYHTFRAHVDPDPRETLHLALLGFVGSWLTWYAFLALYTDRYLFPAVFMGSIFTTAVLYQLTFQFNFKKTIKNAAATFFRSRKRDNFAALITLSVIILQFLLTSSYFFIFYISPGPSIEQVPDHLESITDEQDLIETYESELYFLLDRHYHYPPDIVDVQIISRDIYGDKIIYDYDPLIADPDYLVIGHFGRKTNLYDKVLASGEFNFMHTFQGYDIYSRND